jgi:hypothetical protein
MLASLDDPMRRSEEVAMCELASVLAALAAVDVDDLPAGEQREFIATLAPGADRLAATLTTAVRAADRKTAHQVDGAVSMKAWLRGHCRLDPADAAAIVATGRRPESLPAPDRARRPGHLTKKPAHAP